MNWSLNSDIKSSLLPVFERKWRLKNWIYKRSFQRGCINIKVIVCITSRGYRTLLSLFKSFVNCKSDTGERLLHLGSTATTATTKQFFGLWRIFLELLIQFVSKRFTRSVSPRINRYSSKESKVYKAAAAECHECRSTSHSTANTALAESEKSARRKASTQ